MLVQIRHMYKYVQRRVVGPNQAYVQVRTKTCCWSKSGMCTNKFKDVLLVQIRHMYKYVQRRVGPNQVYVLVHSNTCWFKSGIYTSTYKDVFVQIRHMYTVHYWLSWAGQYIRHMYRTLKLSWQKAHNNCVCILVISNLYSENLFILSTPIVYRLYSIWIKLSSFVFTVFCFGNPQAKNYSLKLTGETIFH